MAIVRIPTQMRSLVGGASTVEIDGDTVGAVLRGLAETHDPIAPRLFVSIGAMIMRGTRKAPSADFCSRKTLLTAYCMNRNIGTKTKSAEISWKS